MDLIGKSPDPLVKLLYFPTLIKPPNFINQAGVLDVTTVDPSNGGRCGDVVATDLMKNFAYCLDMCSQHSFKPSSQVINYKVDIYIVTSTTKI